MAKKICIDCQEIIKSDGLIRCSSCHGLLHDDCAQDINGAIPFCESCYNDISFSNKCPSCGEYELAVWNNGESCENLFCCY